jgi:probable HAF family extracellular repeat protein
MATYNYTTLNDPFALPVATTGTIGQSINDAGQIVGWYQAGTDPVYGFLYSGSNYTTLSYVLNVAPGSTATFNTYAFGINDAGHIVGLIGGGDNEHGFFYSNGTYTILDNPAGTFAPSSNFGSPVFTTIATGINNSDQIVGDYHDINNGDHGFLYSGGKYTTIDDPLGIGTVVNGINDAGQIVGNYGDSSGHQHGFVYIRGNYVTIDDPLGTSTVATGINDAGQIVGYYTDSSGHIHGFLYSGHNFMILDDPLAGGGHAQTVAYGINNSGQIVGFYDDSSGAHGFIATPTHDAHAVTVLGLGATQPDLHLV